MLTITSPHVARALAAGRRRSRRRAAWGTFPQRTATRRMNGGYAGASIAALTRQQVQHGVFGFFYYWPACAAARPAASPAQVTCAACGQGRDLLNECGCSYVPVPASRYFRE